MGETLKEIMKAEILAAEARSWADGITIGEARGRVDGITVGEARGRADGITIGEARLYGVLKAMVMEKVITVSEAARHAGVTVKEFKEKAGLPAEGSV